MYHHPHKRRAPLSPTFISPNPALVLEQRQPRVGFYYPTTAVSSISRERELLEGGDGDTTDNGEQSSVHRERKDLAQEQSAEERREERLARLPQIITGTHTTDSNKAGRKI